MQNERHEYSNAVAIELHANEHIQGQYKNSSNDARHTHTWVVTSATHDLTKAMWKEMQKYEGSGVQNSVGACL